MRNRIEIYYFFLFFMRRTSQKQSILGHLEYVNSGDRYRFHEKKISISFDGLVKQWIHVLLSINRGAPPP